MNDRTAFKNMIDSDEFNLLDNLLKKNSLSWNQIYNRFNKNNLKGKVFCEIEIEDKKVIKFNFLKYSNFTQTNDFEEISELKNLQYLNYHSNLIGNVNLRKLEKLNYLCLAGCDIGSYGGFDMFPYKEAYELNLSNNIYLKYLNLNDCYLSEFNTINHPFLESLDLSHNRIKHLDLRNNKNLKKLILNNNNIEYIELKNQKKLEYFKIENNGVKDFFDKTIKEPVIIGFK